MKRIIQISTFLFLILFVLGTADTWSAFEFGPQAALNSNAFTDAGKDRHPQVITDGSGNWITIWGFLVAPGADWDVHYSRSTDNGATWSPQTALNTNAGTDSGRDDFPSITTDGLGNWVAVWYSNENHGGTAGTDYDICFSRSIDNGTTWTAPATLNTNADTDSGYDTYPQITTDRLGNWITVWDSTDTLGGTIEGDHDILISRSTNNGITWSAPEILNTDAYTDGKTDGNPMVTTDGSGNWVAVWSFRDTSGIDTDLFVSRSTDNGATWTDPAVLNANAGTDSGHDDYPNLITDGSGNWIAVWDSYEDLGGTAGTDRDIFFSRSTDNGITWTDPAILNTNADTDTGNDYVPVLATDSQGKWVVVWFSAENLGGTIGSGDWDIFVALSTDNGITWTDPETLNSNAETDAIEAYDLNPYIATDGSGNWVAVWYSEDDMEGTIGTDADILVSTSSFTPVTSWQLY
jgi:Neuraminidase (sialidase)